MAEFGLIECNRVGCGKTFTRVRQAQRYCSKECRVADAVDRFRSKEEAITTSPPIPSTREAITGAVAPLQSSQKALPEPLPYFNPHAPTPGALQGDDYPLDYYADGYPVLPDCLRRALAND
jgi:hypothetical protein